MNDWCARGLVLLLVGGCTPLRDGPLAAPLATDDVPAGSNDRGGAGSDVMAASDRAESGDSTVPASCPADMVMIPAATFQMGSNELGSMPVHAVRLSAYCIDRTEVTVAAYRACASCAPAGTATSCNGSISGREQHPINCVRFFEAEAYCRAVGKHLPTEAEWEYAARGPEGWIYPWGSAEPSTQPCWDGPSTCTAGSHGSGDSFFRVSDLAGNVEEWTADWFGPYRDTGTVQDNPHGPTAGTAYVTRGGNWATRTEFRNALRTTSRTSLPPDTATPRVGFRCARR